jgi:hypothetical protein
MFMAPVPVILLIRLFQLRKIAGFAVVFFCIGTISLIFLTVPRMVVIVLFVVIGARLLILGSQGCWHYCYWGHKGTADDRCTPETGHVCLILLYSDEAIAGPLPAGV